MRTQTFGDAICFRAASKSNTNLNNSVLPSSLISFPLLLLPLLLPHPKFLLSATFFTFFLWLYGFPSVPPVIFKEVNTCNPATITGTLSRISLDDEDDPKLAAHQEGGVGVNFSSLPGNIPPPNLIVQVQD